MDVIIHSDDIASTPQVTEHILDCWRKGAVQGFSVLANGEALKHVSQVLQEESAREVYVAAHLNLTEGSALTSQEPLRWGFAALVWKAWLNPCAQSRQKFLDFVEAEWRAQIRAVKQALAPRPVNALDGHIHIHMIPGLYELALKLAHEEGIRRIRIPREYAGFGLQSLSVNYLKVWILRYLAWRGRNALFGYHLDSPDCVLGVLDSGRMTVEAIHEGLVRARKRLGEGPSASECEVIVHVGRAHDRELSRWKHCPGVGRFYASEARDRERGEVISFSQVHPSVRKDGQSPSGAQPSQK